MKSSFVSDNKSEQRCEEADVSSYIQKFMPTIHIHFLWIEALYRKVHEKKLLYASFQRIAATDSTADKCLFPNHSGPHWFRKYKLYYASSNIKASLVATAKQHAYCERADGEDREQEKGGSDMPCVSAQGFIGLIWLKLSKVPGWPPPPPPHTHTHYTLNCSENSLHLFFDPGLPSMGFRERERKRQTDRARLWVAIICEMLPHCSPISPSFPHFPHFLW